MSRTEITFRVTVLQSFKVWGRVLHSILIQNDPITCYLIWMSEKKLSFFCFDDHILNKETSFLLPLFVFLELRHIFIVKQVDGELHLNR